MSFRKSNIFSLLLGSICSLYANNKPNVVFIFADDLGYGEIEVLDPKYAKIPTPHLNRLANEGQTYTDAHTSSSVCTPSRYSFLTGRYNWRTRLQTFVLGEGDAPLISPERKTLGHLFREQDYHTAIFGKWHLGLTYQVPNNGNTKRKKLLDGFLLSKAPVGAKVMGGPISRGFDSYYGFNHARSMSSVIENDRIIEEINPVEMLPNLTSAISEYIDQKAEDSKNGKPFFIYFPQNSPHSPLVPSKTFKGSTKLGDYADYVTQTDASVGVVLDALTRNRIRENTLVIFSSDNGSFHLSSQTQKRAPTHRPSGPYRGKKGNLWEGGHRVPFILSWPGVVKAGSKCDQLICLTDMMRTFSDFFSVDLPDNVAEDSISFLPSIYDHTISKVRKNIIHHDIKGYFSIRDGNWKLLLKKFGNSSVQLYNLDKDIGERTNMAGKRPDVLKKLTQLLKSQVEQGRSTPGLTQKNDVPVNIWKDRK
jgi:arylsulfatase A-like enzyme